MIVLLDTNLLVRYANPNDVDHPISLAAIAALRLAGHTLMLVPQNLYEFWVVATRPQANNGLGYSTAVCSRIVASYVVEFSVISDAPNLWNQWLKLVETHQCHGKIAHDARLVAAMRTHGLTHLLTFNAADFARFPGLTVLDPAVVAAPPPTP